MKNHTMAIFLAAWLLFLAAHAGFNGAPAAYQEAAAESTAPVYLLEPVAASQTVRSEDKAAKELARCDYQLLHLTVAAPETLPPAEAEAARRNAEIFNTRMDDLMEDFTDHGAAVGRDAKKAYQDGYFLEAYYDGVTASGAITGEIVSVRMDQSSYTGGAHPNSYASGCLFDLKSGQFILDPAQLADDPAAFQTGAAEKLAEKAWAIRENRDAYWQDYTEIISHWNEGVVLFDEEGMLVVYSTYELGPYAMGAVELRLSWEELAGLMGPAALTRFGVELPERTE